MKRWKRQGCSLIDQLVYTKQRRARGYAASMLMRTTRAWEAAMRPSTRLDQLIVRLMGSTAVVIVGPSSVFHRNERATLNAGNGMMLDLTAWGTRVAPLPSQRWEDCRGEIVITMRRGAER